MSLTAMTIHRQWKKRIEARKQRKRKDELNKPVPEIIDPSFEILQHQQHLAPYSGNSDLQLEWEPSETSCPGQYSHVRQPSQYGGSLAYSNSIRSTGSTDSFLYDYDSDMQSFSAYLGGSTMDQDSPTSEYGTHNAYDSWPARQPPTSAPIAPELEGPPSYECAVATSPTRHLHALIPPDVSTDSHLHNSWDGSSTTYVSSYCRLDSPFSQYDALEDVPDLSADVPIQAARTSSSSASGMEPPTPSEIGAPLHFRDRSFSFSRSPIRDEELGYRDDLVKKGFMM